MRNTTENTKNIIKCSDLRAVAPATIKRCRDFSYDLHCRGLSGDLTPEEKALIKELKNNTVWESDWVGGWNEVGCVKANFTVGKYTVEIVTPEYWESSFYFALVTEA